MSDSSVRKGSPRVGTLLLLPLLMLDDAEEGDSDADRRDKERTDKWLEGRSWRVQEGLSKEWAEFADALRQR